MGTRAMITIDGKPFVATHWDGDTGSLGAELNGVKTKKDIITIAKKHKIDFKGLQLKNYDDWAEYEYDYDTKTKDWRVRQRSGSWRENRPHKWDTLGNAVYRTLSKVV